MQFPKELYDASEERVRQLLMQASAINPNWTTIEYVVDNVRHSPALREVLAGALSPRHPSQLYEAVLEGVLLFAILWISGRTFGCQMEFSQASTLLAMRSSYDR